MSDSTLLLIISLVGSALIAVLLAAWLTERNRRDQLLRSIHGAAREQDHALVAYLVQPCPLLSSRPLSSDQWRTIPAVVYLAAWDAAEQTENMVKGRIETIRGIVSAPKRRQTASIDRQCISAGNVTKGTWVCNE